MLEKTVEKRDSIEDFKTENQITALYVGWTDKSQPPSYPKWVPIYRMSWDNQGFFYYSYTHGFKQNLARLRGKLVNPDCGYTKTWATKQIHPIVSSRIPRRPDSMKEYDYLGLGDRRGDFLAFLARCGGTSATDNYDIFPELTADEQGYCHFYSYVVKLVRNVRQNPQVKQIADTIQVGKRLDPKRNDEHTELVYGNVVIGQLPNYLHHLLQHPVKERPNVTLYQVNNLNRRYAYKLVVKVSIRFQQDPFRSGREFEPLNPMPHLS